MTTRSRYRSVVGQSGTATNKISGYKTHKAPVTFFQVTTDVVGNHYGENPFDSRRGTITVPGLINGENSFSKYENYPVSFASSGYNPTLTALPGESFGDVNKAIADSHPVSPPVSIPNFLYELKDLPGMIRHAISRASALEDAAKSTSGRNGLASVAKYMENPKNPAEDWLNFHFGWSPLIGDLFALTGVARYLQQRLRWLNTKAQRISRERQLGEFSSTTSVVNAAYDSNLGIYCNYTEYNKSRSWVVSHWKHSPVVSKALLENQFLTAMIAAGFDAPISSIWNAVPFTWLTDWFVDIGSIITIRENRSGITFLNASMMTQRDRTLVLHPKVPSGWPFKTNVMQCEAVHKNRVPVAPSTPTVGGTNILQPQHLATLASLKVTRGAGVAF